MTLKKLTLIAYIFLTAIPGADAQVSNGLMSLDDLRRPQKRDLINIPDVNGFKVLKCDFHIHTVFSDGSVWPDIRLQEAIAEGLDAISLTDHMEYQPHSKEVSTNNNIPYELISKNAEKNNILLIKGTEVTRNTPPGHFNAIFTGDVSNYVTDNSNLLDKEAVRQAGLQNAFIFWNHPGWKPNIEGSYEWIPFVDDLYRNKLLHGVEVFNGFTFHMKALDWCVDKGLTVIGSSDAHNLISHTYDPGRSYIHRTMTLVMAKERSVASVKEALISGRTVAWAGKYIAGKEEYVRDLFHACVETGPVHYTEKNSSGAELKYYEIRNNSDLYFELKLKSGKGTPGFTLYPGSSFVIWAETGQNTLIYDVMTAFVRSDRNLTVELPGSLPQKEILK